MPQLIGTELAAGQSVTCVFTIAGYAPAADGSLIDTVSVTVVDRGQPRPRGRGLGHLRGHHARGARRSPSTS